MAVLRMKFTKTKRDKLAQILWILNWISVVTGAILFSLGLFLKVEIYKREELMAKRDIQYVPNMLIAVGLIACAINFLGGKICYDCVDSTKFLRWKLIMLPYIICTFFFTFCVLVGALMCYSMRGELEESLNLGLTEAMKFYKDTDTPGRCFLKRTVDMLQIEFQCCGNNGYKDWFQIQWDQQPLPGHVPKRGGRQITNNSAHFNYEHQTEQLNLWLKGCRQALLEYYNHIMQSIGLTVLITWLFELSVLTGVRFLQTSLENVLRQGDPNCESDGWLLENSFIETARINLNIIKNLGKCNQIDTANNGDP
ncbi:Photoreceptor outer segment membrane glycoprotein 2 CRDS2 [Collichthys lucidus]|uniref:Photoreceptor outer segment membrane glycoprotein 2 CRDS2 n=1 Tax=Collichthys lucidus TaxID=240159 RepID=A0A4U5VHD7_COLLU|nr:Photoreceptor outer segment membrane glycoprotein 2 CRDS2 [Collichthys lucidus]